MGRGYGGFLLIALVFLVLGEICCEKNEIKVDGFDESYQAFIASYKGSNYYVSVHDYAQIVSSDSDVTGIEVVFNDFRLCSSDYNSLSDSDKKLIVNDYLQYDDEASFNEYCDLYVDFLSSDELWGAVKLFKRADESGIVQEYTIIADVYNDVTKKFVECLREYPPLFSLSNSVTDIENVCLWAFSNSDKIASGSFDVLTIPLSGCESDYFCNVTNCNCESKPIFVCSASELFNCRTETDCKSVNGFWLGDHCTSNPCPDCSLDNLGYCFYEACCGFIGGAWFINSAGDANCFRNETLLCTANQLFNCNQTGCLGVGGKWCGNTCQVNCCGKTSLSYCFNESECVKNNGTWYYVGDNAAYCDVKNLAKCSRGNITYCSSVNACRAVNGYWCNNTCINETCKYCTKNEPWNCLTMDSCLLINNYWCIDGDDKWCQLTECKSGVGVCETGENCLNAPIDCRCPEDYACAPTMAGVDYRGCLYGELLLDDGFCDTSKESCANSDDCACNNNSVCTPDKADADNMGCVLIAGNQSSNSVVIDGVCSVLENCADSADCACKSGYSCVNKTCVLSKPISDGKCSSTENCANSRDCACPNGYACDVNDAKALSNGCVPPIYEKNSIYSCRLGDNCIVNPACMCAPGEVCNPKSESADNFGCVPKLTCDVGTTCCGNRVCDKGECSSCPVDCTAGECNNNGVCDLVKGENCANSNDCACSSFEYCNLESSYADVKGCLPIDDAFCGNGVIEKGETEVNCCLDAGCSAGSCVPGNGVMVDTGFRINYRPDSYSCKLSVCGDGLVSGSETEVNCCLDAGCSVGECAKTDFDSYKCVKPDTCGDGVVDSYESSINCCLDAGCPDGLTCSGNECVSSVNQACEFDSDCACFNGCGVINIDYGLSNPVCSDRSITCSKVLPVCIGGVCKARLVSLKDNEVIDYVSALTELRTRLFSFNEVIIDISSFLESAVSYYESVNNTLKAGELSELVDKIVNFNKEYFLLIREIDDAINQPSRASVNYILNRVESFEGLLIDVSAKILEATGDEL